jgi:hypothetical protein
MSVNELWYFSVSLHRMCLNYCYNVEGALRLNSEEFKLRDLRMGVVSDLGNVEFMSLRILWSNFTNASVVHLELFYCWQWRNVGVILLGREIHISWLRSGRRHFIAYSYIIHWLRNSLSRYVISMENIAGLLLFLKIRFFTSSLAVNINPFCSFLSISQIRKDYFRYCGKHLC